MRVKIGLYWEYDTNTGYDGIHWEYKPRIYDIAMSENGNFTREHQDKPTNMGYLILQQTLQEHWTIWKMIPNDFHGETSNLAFCYQV